MHLAKIFGGVPIAIGLGTNAYFLGVADPFFGWTALPYGVCALALMAMKSPGPATFTASLVATVDLLNAYSVFIGPTSSTGGLNYLWMPFWNLVIVCPVGLLFGWAVARIVARRNLTTACSRRPEAGAADAER